MADVAQVPCGPAATRPSEIQGESRAQNAHKRDTEARAFAIVQALPTWAWLAAIVALSAAFRIAADSQLGGPFVFGDELIYSELARSFAATGHFAIRGVPDSSYGVVYPVLIAPAYALSKDLAGAYALVKIINAAVMSLAAIPTYFISRRVLRRNLALLASGFSVGIPSLVYTGVALTENVFYPAFLLSVLAMIRATERPSAMRQLAVFGSLGFAYLIRVQAVVLVPAYIVFVLLLIWLEDRPGMRRGTVRRAAVTFRVTWLLLIATAAIVFAVQAARDRSPVDLLGVYRDVTNGMRPSEIPRWFLYHLADLDLYLGIVPFAACMLLFPAALRGIYGRAIRAFAALTASLTLCLLLVVSALSSSKWGLGRLHERNLFYVAPLLIIAFLIWIELGAPRPHIRTVLCAFVSAALPLALPFVELVKGSVVDALGLVAWATTVLRPSAVPEAMAIYGLVLAAAFILLRARLTPALILLVAINALVLGNQSNLHAQAAANVLGASHAHQTWIDTVVGPSSEVAMVWLPNRLVCTKGDQAIQRQAAFAENEFFNKSVRSVYYLVQPPPDGMPARKLTVDSRTNLLMQGGGEAFKPRFLALDRRLKIRAPVLAVDRRTQTILYRFIPGAKLIPPHGCLGFIKLTVLD